MPAARARARTLLLPAGRRAPNPSRPNAPIPIRPQPHGVPTASSSSSSSPAAPARTLLPAARRGPNPSRPNASIPIHPYPHGVPAAASTSSPAARARLLLLPAGTRARAAVPPPKAPRLAAPIRDKAFLPRRRRVRRRARHARLPLPARAFGESQNWYFFCPVKAQITHDGRRPRIVAGGKGTWKSDRGKNVVDPVEGCVVGRRERFTHVPKPKEEGKPTEWLMTEFSVDQQEGGAVPGMVLYKIYRSPRFLKNASKASSSSSASVSARKRKAADELLDDLSPPPSLSARKTVNATSGSSSPVRRQLLFPSPPAEVAPNPPAEVAPNPPASVAPNPPAEVAPNNLTAEVDEMMAEYLADDKNWEGFSCIANPSSAPWSCSMMTMASNPLCSGPEFLNSIVAAP